MSNKKKIGFGAVASANFSKLKNYNYSDDIKNGLAYYGKYNDLPYKYLNLLDDTDESGISSTWHGISIEAIVKYIQGDGLVLTNDAGQIVDLDSANQHRETYNEVFHKLAYDYKLYGGCAIEVIWSSEFAAGITDTPQISEMYQIPFKDIRAKEKNYRGLIEGWFVSSKWKRQKNAHLNNEHSQYIPVFNPSKVQVRENQNGDPISEQKQILVIKKYNPASEYYPEPDYKPALQAIQIDSDVSVFKQRKIANDISTNMIIQFVADPSTYGDIAKDFADQYQGNHNAGDPILLNAKSTAESHVITTPSNSKGNAETYNSYEDAARQRILSAHGITFGEIVGIDDGKSLFGDEKAEKYNTFLNTTIRDLQMPLLSGLNKLSQYIVEGDFRFEINPIDINAGLNGDAENVVDEEQNNE